MREVARKRRTVELLSRLLGVVGKVYDGGLEARKAHIERAPVNLRARQHVDAALALVGELVHRRAAGVGKAEHARGLVEALARRIVARRAEERKVRVVAHVDDERVAAGHAQRQKRRLKLWER